MAEFDDVRVCRLRDHYEEIDRDAQIDEEVDVEERGVDDDEGLFPGTSTNEAAQLVSQRTVYADTWTSDSPENRGDEETRLDDARHDEGDLLRRRHEVVCCDRNTASVLREQGDQESALTRHLEPNDDHQQSSNQNRQQREHRGAQPRR